jgi:hypothetical protein
MTQLKYQHDLIVLVADKNMEFSMKGILQRPEALEIINLSFKIYSHIEKDPGCFLWGHDFLRPFVNKFRHALVMLDRRDAAANI